MRGRERGRERERKKERKKDIGMKRYEKGTELMAFLFSSFFHLFLCLQLT